MASPAPAVAPRPPARTPEPAARTPRPAGGPAAPGATPAPAGPEVSLKGSDTFAPPQALADYLATHPRGGGDVAVRFPGVAAGVIKVVERRGKYRTAGDLQAIEVRHPLLDPLRPVGLVPMLTVEVADSRITGFVTVSTGRRPVGNPREIFTRIERNATALGFVGLDTLRTKAPENKLQGGSLSLKANLAFKVGGFFDGTGNIGLTDDVVTFNADAQATPVKGADPLKFHLERSPEGVVGGRGEVPVNFKNFSGSFVIVLAGGVVDVTATARYRTEKLSGEVTLLVTDRQTARTVAYQHLPPQAIEGSAREAAGGSAVAAAPTTSGPRPGPRAVAGWGTLDVHYNEWLTGKALVIVDGEGHVTVVGKLTPPAKVEFNQTKLDIERKIFSFEARASYGIPVVGNIFVFAGVGLFAIAKVSPLTISRIEIGGTYSTDPTIFNSFSLSANLNISALAGLKLRAEAGAGLEILDHDIKIGAGINAMAGVRAYVDATPVIGYRELADPMVGRRGEFYIHGEAEMAGQAFLGLGGDLFVKIVTPWWSPLSDKTWTWPLGELIYPIGEFGFGADVDYVLGSGKLPTISPKTVDFSADKFIGDLMDDTTPHGSATETRKPGKWSERLQPPPPPPPAPPLKNTRGAPRRRDDRATRDAGRSWADGMRAVEQLRARAEAHPLAAPELEPALAAIRRRYGFSVLAAQPVGEYWVVSATLGTQTSRRPVRIKRAPGAGAAPTASTPSLPEKVFEAGGERHRIYIVIHNGHAIPMISSEAKRVKEFLGAVPPRFADDEERANALKAAKRLADDVDRLANDLENLIVRNARASNIQAKRSDLGTHEMKLADQLHIALGGVNISKLDRGYLLEGVVGTYGTVPEQRRDRMTPDHQPQDSLMKYAAGLTIGSTRRKLFAGLRMGRYATNDGWAINLHHQRHVWGQTYGKPPQPKVINRLDAIATANQTEAVQQRAVIRVLRTAAEDDADQIEAALKNGDDHDVWSDLKRKIPGRDAKAIDDRNALRDRIRDRVRQGETRIRRQPLEDFLR